MDNTASAVREARIETWSIGTGATGDDESLWIERHVALLLALTPISEDGERIAISDWEGIRVGGTLHLFGYVRELHA